MKKLTLILMTITLALGGYAQCDATFYASTDTSQNFAVNFYPLDSINSVSTYSWDFGDGTTGTASWENHIYSSVGAYIVCLTVDDGAGCTNTYCDSIWVDSVANGNGTNVTCSADFYWWQPQDSLTGAYSSNVYLVNMSGGSNLSYTWDFGDGTSGTGQYPTHNYANVGMYIICLTVDNGNGCTDTYCDTISVMAKASGFTLNVISEAEAATVGIGEEELINSTSIFPNPVKSGATLAINSSRNANVTIILVDVSGKQISRELVTLSLGNNQLNINTDQLPNGFYLLNISAVDESFTETLRFTKQ